MEYSYTQDRQENRANPESTSGHPQSQHALHYQHQQFASTHPALQAAYSGLRLPPYLNPLQGTAPSPGLLHVQEGGAPSRGTSSGAVMTSRESSQGGQDFENVLSTVLQGPGIPSHFRQDPSHSQHSIPVPLHQISPLLSSTTTQPSSSLTPQQQPSTHNVAPEASYHLEDLSNSNIAQRQQLNTSVNTHANTTPRSNILTSSVHTTKSSSQNKGPVSNSRATTPKKRAIPATPAERAPMAQIVNPQVPPPRRNAPVFCKYSQTAPLFEQKFVASAYFSKETEIPEGLVYLKTGEEGDKICGVKTTRRLEKGVDFGPFTGEFVKESLGCLKPSTWEICVRGRTWYYIDGDTDPNNWMHCVGFARSTEEQNLEAFQSYGDIFFRTTRPIEAGSELRVFYSRDYGHRVGFRTDLDKLIYFTDAERFECRDCDNRYTNAKSLMRHIKFDHDKENNVIPPDPSVQPFATPNTNITILTENDKRVPNNRQFAPRMGLQKDRDVERVKRGMKRKEETNKRFMKVKFVPLSESHRRKAEKERAHYSEEEEEEEEGDEGMEVEDDNDDDDGEDNLTCKRCRKTFPSEGHLKQHAMFHEEMKDVKPLCEVCGLECKSTRALKQHMLSHDPDAFQCEFCKKFFRRKGCLLYHLRHTHQKFVGEKWSRGDIREKLARYVGPGDGDGEEEEAEGEFHPDIPKDMLDAENPDEPGYPDELPWESDPSQPGSEEKKGRKQSCATCGQECENKRVFRQHMLSHDPNSYQCLYCDWFFKRKGCLIFHLRTRHRVFVGRRWSRGSVQELMAKTDPVNIEEEVEEYVPAPLRQRKTVAVKKYVPQVCTICGEESEHTKAFRQHMLSHNPKAFQCLYCGWYFKRKGDYNFHVRLIHQVNLKVVRKKRKPVKRSNSRKSSKSKQDSNSKKNSHARKKKKEGKQPERTSSRVTATAQKKTTTLNHVCSICNLECKHSKDLKQHEMSHDPNIFQCVYCKRYFRRRHDLAFHLRHKHQVDVGRRWQRDNHLRQTLLKKTGVDQSAEMFPDKPAQLLVGEHISVTPEPEKEKEPPLLKCRFCSLQFKDRGSVFRHERIIHSKSKNKCRVCGKSFSTKFALQSHSRMHSKEKNCECHVCGKRFALKVLLVRHLIEHEEEGADEELVRAAMKEVSAQSSEPAEVKGQSTGIDEEPRKPSDVAAESVDDRSSLNLDD